MDKPCDHKRSASVVAKCSDLFNVAIDGKDYDGYVPGDLGIGGGDYVEFTYCLDCGKIAGEFPLQQTALETMP